jgi:hypothetical protein
MAILVGLLALQAKAVNYTGAFSSPGDPVSERVWYTAAYTVRGDGDLCKGAGTSLA